MMQKVFLTSDLGCSEKINGVRYCRPIDNRNGIIDQIKFNLDDEGTFIFFASSPNNYEKTDNYAKNTFESFNKSGFNFKELIIVDNRYNGDLNKDIKKSSLVFLTGGNTEIEMKFFDKIN